MYQVSPFGWHLTMAMPSIDAWMMADPEVRAVFDADELTRTSRRERSLRIGEMAARRPIDRKAISREHPEFQPLLEFVKTHSPLVQPTA